MQSQWKMVASCLLRWAWYRAFEQGGKILSVAACEESQSVASASSNGSVHVWRVEHTTRSGGAPDRYTGIIGGRTPQVQPLGLSSWSEHAQVSRL